MRTIDTRRSPLEHKKQAATWARAAVCVGIARCCRFSKVYPGMCFMSNKLPVGRILAASSLHCLMWGIRKSRSFGRPLRPFCQMGHQEGRQRRVVKTSMISGFIHDFWPPDATRLLRHIHAFRCVLCSCPIIPLHILSSAGSGGNSKRRGLLPHLPPMEVGALAFLASRAGKPATGVI